MPGVFISYRRDDSAGFAGRLADDLGEVFGSDSIFMDVTGIEPGIDFRKAIEQQVGDCAAVLVVIGRSWLGGRGTDGAPRLHDATDLVRLEVASALRRDIPVIPVLVDGAAMPPARDLPPDLEPLAWRNAVEVRHARWDADVQVVISALRKLLQRTPAAATSRTGAPMPAPPAAVGETRTARSLLWPLVAGAAIVVLVALVWLRPWQAPGDDGRTDAANSPPVAGNSSAGGNDMATLPVSADVTVASARIQVLSALLDRTDPRRVRLTFFVRMTTLGGGPANLWNDLFRLQVDDVARAPVNLVNEVVEGYSAKEADVAFDIEPAVKNVVLQVSIGSETTRIPIDLSAAVPGRRAAPARRKLPGPFPMSLATTAQVRADNVVYHILSASIRRRNMERLELHVGVRAMNERGYAVNFWDNTFRLEVDGVPRSPVSHLNDIVQSNSARDGEVVFVFEDTVDTLTLLVGDGPNKNRVPLDLKR